MTEKPQYQGTRLRAIRVPDELWEPAVQLTAERGESVSEVVRAALARYVKRHSAPAK